MKKLFLFFTLILLPAAIFAAPFGLEMGMTLEEITEQCEEEPVFVGNDVYLIKPKKTHPVFTVYGVYVNQNVGLYQIRAVSDEIKTNRYGTELQNTFNNVKDRISKTYGRPKINNNIDRNLYDIYQQDDYWFYTLREGSRELSAVWGKSSPLADNLDLVTLECSALNGYLEGSGQLVLYYYFSNSDSVEDEQDSVF